jgi:hypothetical protein
MRPEFIKNTVIITATLLLSSIISDFAITNLPGITHYLWRSLGLLLIAIPTTVYIQNTWLQKQKLTLALWLIVFIIGTFNILIEAYIFNVTTGLQTLQGMWQGFLSVTPGLLAIGLLLIKKTTPPLKLTRQKRSILGYSWRILAGNVLYFIFYASAGMVLQASYPELMDFYEGKIPHILLIVKTNLFFRGFVFVSIAILIAETSQLNKWKTGMLIGAFFSILGGIAPLLSPNELMPLNIRLAHGLEVGISNFLYGIVLGLFFTRSEVKGET